jgi:hypothetical protein
VQSIRSTAGSTAPVADDQDATRKTLANHSELNALLKDMGEARLCDLLSVTSSGDAGLTTLLAKNKGVAERHPLLIPDFVSQPKGAYVGDKEEILVAVGLNQLVMRGKRKPALDQITLPQWLSANCRILLQLVAQDKITTEGVSQYLHYTAEVGDLCQTYTTPSVMLLDNAHRIRQNQLQCAWTDTDSHSRDFYLERRQQVSNNKSTNQPTSNANKPKSVDAQGREICRSFNQADGCHWANCKFQHTCLVPGCGANHPKHQHDSTPPRFRGQPSST